MYLLVGALFVLLVGLAIWATTRDEAGATGTPPAAEGTSPEDTGVTPRPDPGTPTPSTAWGPLEVDLEALDGVESATVLVYDEYVEGIPLPAPEVTVDLESHRTPDEAQATVDAAYVLLLSAGLPAVPRLTVVDTVPGTGGTLTVAHAGPADRAVRDAVTLLDAGAASVRFTGDNAAVTGAGPASLPGLAEVARVLDRGLNSLGDSTFGTLYSSPAEPVRPSAPAVALLVAAAERPETNQVVHEIRSPQGTPSPCSPSWSRAPRPPPRTGCAPTGRETCSTPPSPSRSTGTRRPSRDSSRTATSSSRTPPGTRPTPPRPQQTASRPAPGPTCAPGSPGSTPRPVRAS